MFEFLRTPLTALAYEVACTAHAGQVDKAGEPYILHPLAVAEQMDNEIAAAVALLHDVLEDTDIELSQLAELGFPQEVLETVVLLTHGKEDGMTYLEYVRGLKGYPIAEQVKRADLRHNMDLTRLPLPPTAKDLSRVERYKKAMAILDA